MARININSIDFESDSMSNKFVKIKSNKIGKSETENTKKDRQNKKGFNKSIVEAQRTTKQFKF